MPRTRTLTDASGEVPPLTDAALRALQPAGKLPAALQRKLGVRGPQRTPTKERITIRLSHDVVEQFRATGDGWQTRIDKALQEWLSARGHSAT
ncbi:BrnA antitoxin family protein [Candidatus Skiveiella danica]|uniref:BrnA antitoxin family protein n=1 Tax=Candidatus Skiveiella danica TaxID=3386177 RepID=UPI0009C871A3|nr:MAG: hypothetical protein BWX79_03271 [Alphaproteobacteria bacterium ADurb.Bin100]